jgi:type III restriction enzyme
VNQNGERNHEPNINTLTVVANESYDDFARGLQKEFENDGYKFGILTPESFYNVVVVKPNGEEEYFGFEKSKMLYEYFLENKQINEKGAITPELKKAVEHGTVELPGYAEPAKEQIKAIITNKASKLVIKDKSNEVKVELKKDVTDNPAFQELWERIRQRTRYELEVDTEKLIDKAIEGISHMPEVHPVEVISQRAGLSIDDAGVDAELVGQAKVTTSAVRVYDLPDPIWELQDIVGLTRKTIRRILEGCGRFDEFAIDPATFLAQVVAKIDRAKLEVLSKGIKYTKLPESDWYTMEVLQVDDLTAYLDQNAYEPKNDKSIYNYVVYDSSTVERPFACDLDMAEDVKVFAKLPSKFTIDTPVGSYSPDWAYVTEDAYGGKRVFFVVETKGGGNIDPTTRPREAAKIDCARKHFAALDDGVTYSVRTTYAATSF